MEPPPKPNPVSDSCFPSQPTPLSPKPDLEPGRESRMSQISSKASSKASTKSAIPEADTQKSQISNTVSTKSTTSQPETQTRQTSSKASQSIKSPTPTVSSFAPFQPTKDPSQDLNQDPPHDPSHQPTHKVRKSSSSTINTLSSDEYQPLIGSFTIPRVRGPNPNYNTNLTNPTKANYANLPQDNANDNDNDNEYQYQPLHQTQHYLRRYNDANRRTDMRGRGLGQGQGQPQPQSLGISVFEEEGWASAIRDFMHVFCVVLGAFAVTVVVGWGVGWAVAWGWGWVGGWRW